MKYIRKYNEDFQNLDEGLKSMATGMIAALGLLFGSCTYVNIEDRNGKDVNNVSYANKTSIGTIKDMERGSKGRLHVVFVDKNDNLVHATIRPNGFFREDTPKLGDSIKLKFDEEGKTAEVYLKDDYDKKPHRHRGASFWQ